MMRGKEAQNPVTMSWYVLCTPTTSSIQDFRPPEPELHQPFTNTILMNIRNDNLPSEVGDSRITRFPSDLIHFCSIHLQSEEK